MSRFIKHSRGFTLIELIIVMVLLGIAGVFSARFIADMAQQRVSAGERAQALSGARFTLERLRRELSQAYSPSVYVSDDQQCVSFVPATAAGTYFNKVQDKSARFLMPISLVGEPLHNTFVAVYADSGADYWSQYPDSLPDNVAKFADFDSVPNTGTAEGETTDAGLAFNEAIISTGQPFSYGSSKQRFTLLQPWQARYCLNNDQLVYQKRDADGWSEPVLMLQQVRPGALFSEYDGSLQLLRVNLVLSTRDGLLALPSQLQVNYEP